MGGGLPAYAGSSPPAEAGYVFSVLSMMIVFVLEELACEKALNKTNTLFHSSGSAGALPSQLCQSTLVLASERKLREGEAPAEPWFTRRVVFPQTRFAPARCGSTRPRPTTQDPTTDVRGSPPSKPPGPQASTPPERKLAAGPAWRNEPKLLNKDSQRECPVFAFFLPQMHHGDERA